MERREVIATTLRRVFVRPAVASTRRHLVLLVTMIAVLVVQPAIAHWSATSADVANALFGLLYVYILVIIFRPGRHRRIAVALFVPVAIANFALYAVPARTQLLAAMIFHGTIVVFLGYAVVTILRELFGRSVVSGDDVLGAACGYILGGLAWAQLYGVVYLVRPEAFSVSPDIAAELTNLHLRHAIFNYFSFTTLTSIGYGDITPIGPPVYSLMWLEVMFGQFYMAVVVAQLVGLKLAQAIARDESRPR